MRKERQPKSSSRQDDEADGAEPARRPKDEASDGKTQKPDILDIVDAALKDVAETDQEVKEFVDGFEQKGGQ